MSSVILRHLALTCAILPLIASAATRYVSPTGSHTAPFLSWETAATDMQSAIGATTPGDIVLVTNGVYATGGSRAPMGMTNRVTITNAITVRSVNGPEVTVIEGFWQPGSTNGPASVRCAYLGSGATLDGFTLTNGSTSGPYDHGGGALCAVSSVLTNCIVIGNVTMGQGGGVYSGIVRNSRIENNVAAGSGGGSSLSVLSGCIVRSNISGANGGGAYAGNQTDAFTDCAFIRNQALQGGGIYAGSINNVRNCTIVQNSARSSGGVAGGKLVGCIIYYNSAQFGPNYLGTSSLTFSCTTPLTAFNSSNISTPPGLLPDLIHLSSDSPCIGTGPAVGVGEDIDGSPRNSPTSIGCDEWTPAPIAITEALRAIPAEPAGNVVLSFPIAGATPWCQWTKDGVLLADGDHYGSADSSQLLVKAFGLSDAGFYQVVATNSYGSLTSAVMQVSVACVDLQSAAPSAPYASWATAATNIQDAVDACEGTTVVLVTNGVYAERQSWVSGYGANRLVLAKPVTVLSVHGAGLTTLEGAWDPASTNGPASVRCVWLGPDAFLGGFTLSNGSATNYGGGVLGTVTPVEPQIFECVITNCTAELQGGGVYGASVIRSVLNGNRAASGGAMAMARAVESSLNGNSGSMGAGAYNSFLERCQVIGNFGAGIYGGEIVKSTIATNAGAGIANGKAENCRLVGNTGSGAVGSLVWGSLVKANQPYGSDGSTNLNCTLVANALGARTSVMTNCLFAYNGVPGLLQANQGSMSRCILQPGMLPGSNAGGSNWMLLPNLRSDMEHISVDSACIGRGTNHGVVKFDLDGEPYANPPAIGCDEYYPALHIAAQPRVLPGDLPGEAVLFFDLAGSAEQCRWFKEGVTLQTGGRYADASSNALRIRDFGPLDAGDYQVEASNSFGVVTSAVVRVKVACVDPNTANATPPFSTWQTAAATPQAAVDAADAQTAVIVTNGVYTSGSRAVGSDTPNRLVVDKPITLISARGAETTVIEGRWDPVSTNGQDSVRCAWLGVEAMMGGFTFRNGSSQTNGGGVWMSGSGPALNLARCVVTNCSAAQDGGGVAGGHVVDSVIAGNSAAQGGGTARSIVERSRIQRNTAGQGGGVFDGTLQGCWIHENTASTRVAGALLYNGMIVSSSIAFNTAPTYAGVMGGSFTPLYHCTVVSNTASAGRVAGVDFVNIYNSIIYYNSGVDVPGWGKQFENLGGSVSFSYVCSPFPTTTARGAITNAPPQLVDIAHLAATSPCIEAGAPLGNTGFNDIDGEPWRARPAIGCDEFTPAGLVGPLSVRLSGWPSIAAGGTLPLAALIEGRASAIEWNFGDGVITNQVGYNPFHAWSSPGSYVVTATVFNNDHPNGVAASLPISVVPLENPEVAGTRKTAAGFELSFSSQPGVTYEIYGTSNLADAAGWQLLKTVRSTEPVTSFADTNITAGSRFYRLKVK